MPDNGNGNTDEIVHFEELEQDGGAGTGPSKRDQLMALLNEKLKPEDMSQVRELLGLSKDLSNAELLEEFRKELAKKKKEEEEEEEKKGQKKPEDEYEYPEEKTKKGAAPNYQQFMKSCMKDGKSLKECAAEFKEKYKEPSKEEATDVERLAATDWKTEIDLARKKKKDEEEEEDEYPEPVKKKLKELEDEINALKKLQREEGIDHKIDAMVQEKHLSPRQAEGVKKLMYSLPEGQHEELLGVFRSQSITVHEDVGKQPGAQVEELTSERRQALIKGHGLDRLMEEKGGRLPGKLLGVE